MQIFITNIHETLLLIAALLILIDIFLSYEIPTHIAYILLTIALIIKIQKPMITSLLLSVIIWFAFVVFHYTIWRKLLEKFHDKVLSPRKHIGGIDGLVGKKGVIKEIEGNQFIQIDKDLYQFENELERIIIVGKIYKVIKISSNKLVI